MYGFAAALVALSVTQQEPAPAVPAAVPPPVEVVVPGATLPAPVPRPPRPAPLAPPPAPAGALPERERILEAALGFVGALLRGDAPSLAAASTSRFSFDGVVVEGREAQARRWREIFAARGARGRDVLRDLVLLTGEEAVAQLGEAPPRVAALARPGGWVAVADVTGRPLVLFLSRDGGRFAVAGMHD